MIIHAYFILFFSENKARLSSKISSNKWVNKLKGEPFDKILYLQEVDFNSSCPEGYEIYNSTQWPGTKRGIKFDQVTSEYPCKILLNSNDNFSKIPTEIASNYSQSSIFNPLIGAQNYFIEYDYNGSLFEFCSNNNEDKCSCQEKIITNESFYKSYPGNTSPHKIIKEIKPVNLNFIKNKKLCKKSVSNFTIIKKNEKCDGILCGENNLCIKNEKNCPIYSNLTIFNLKDTDSGEQFLKNEKIISSLDINYNGIPCSVLDNTTYDVKIPDESRHELSNFNDIIKNGQPKCKSESNDNYEDIIFLYSFNTLQYYNLTNISNIYNSIPNYSSKINPNDKISLSAKTYFKLNDSKDGNCTGDILQTVNKSFKIIKQISKNKTKNFFILDAIFVIIFIIIIVKHFSKLNVRTEPVSKFWMVKYLIIFTTTFLFVYFVIFYISKESDNNSNDISKKLDIIVENKCFQNSQYNKYLAKLSKRLDEYILLTEGIYNKVLMENIFVIIIALALTLPRISFKKLILI